MPVITAYGEYPETFAKYIRATKMANHDHGYVRKIANTIKKDCKTDLQAIKATHEFVANLPLGYDREDKAASYILSKGRGQCNTKTTLFIALLRYIGVPCRVHAWKVKKDVHKPHMPSLVYSFTPSTTIFTYPEVYYKKKWQLISEVLKSRSKPDFARCPFDDAPQRTHPLKKEWIAEDLGTFWHPDSVVRNHGTNTDGWRKLAFPLAQKMLNRK